MNKFRFELGQSVRLAMSGEEGKVTGRAEYATMENQYRVLYRAGDGRQVECWWDESSIEEV